MSKMVYAQVFDEKTERWVVRKVPALEPVTNPKRRVARGDPAPHRAQQCLNCQQLFMYHFRHRTGYIICHEGQIRAENPQYFEW